MSPAKAQPDNKGYAVIFKGGQRVRDLLVVKDSLREAREFRTQVASWSRDHSGARRKIGREYDVVAVDTDKIAAALGAGTLNKALPVWKDNGAAVRRGTPAKAPADETV